MEDNPYSIFVNKFKPISNQLTMYIGEVTNISPLTISTAGITLSGDELRVNAAMLKHNALISMPDKTENSEITPDLAVGDTVILLTVDTQLFYVLCKVV